MTWRVICIYNRLLCVHCDCTHVRIHTIMAMFPGSPRPNLCTKMMSEPIHTLTHIGKLCYYLVTHTQTHCHFSVDNPIPIDFQCIRSWSDVAGTFQFQLNWTIPDSPDLHDAITKFHILLTFISPGAHPETRDAAEILFDVCKITS